MALSSTSPPKGVVISVPVLVLSVATAAIFLFFLLSSLSSSTPPCSCPTTAASSTTNSEPIVTSDRISASKEDVEWVKRQIDANDLHMAENVLRKGINPRTREQQLQDLLQYVPFS